MSLPAIAADGPALSVDAAAARHSISPDIYGINDFSDKGLANELRVGVKRWGGDASSRYSFKTDTYNAAGDWYFESFAYDDPNPGALPANSSFDRFVDSNLRSGVKSLGTVPMIGWLPKSRDNLCGFSVAKYGPQQKSDPYHADCGNGIKLDGSQITGNDPNDTSIPVDTSFAQDWVRHVTARYGTASRGGVQLWSLDNEPEWWMGVHIDVHPKPATYDEMATLGIAYAAAIKSVDPTALVTGPVPSGWMAYFYSGADFVAGWHSVSPWHYDTNPVDRNAHGGVAFLDWYLQQMRNYEQKNGVRLLDYLDVHAYLTPANIAFGTAGGTAHPEMDTLRLTSTRVLWDPNYVFADNVINAPPRLLPRMHDWVNNNYPGTKLAVTEYNWGALEDVTGAIAQADVLGIFGREGLDLGAMWAPPDPTQPGAFAFRIFLNYDGKGGGFGETSVSATTVDPDQLSIFAAERSDHALTVLVLNKTTADLSSAVNLANFKAAPSAEVYTYSPANLQALVRSDAALTGGMLPATFPAHSMTLFVIPAAADSLPAAKPVVGAVKNAASWDARGIAAGQIVVIGGQNLGPATLVTGDVSSGAFASSLNGVRVLFDGVAAPVIYASQSLVSAVVPYTAALQTAAHIQVEYQGVRSDPFSMAVMPTAPGLFSLDASGSGQGAIVNQDGSINGAQKAAKRGDVVILYATGEGVTDPPGVAGRLATEVLPKPVAACAVTMGGLAAQVNYCGAAPGYTAGLIQINTVVPKDAGTGAQAVAVTIGGVTSQASITVAVQ